MIFTVRGASLLVATIALLAAAPQMTPLSALAGHGYAVSWLSLEDAVQITGHGEAYTVHLGSRYVDNADGTIVLDAVPVLIDGHVEVPESFIRRLDAHDQSVHADASPGIDPPASGALKLQANFVPGSEALHIAGTAPAAVPINLTIWATFDPDVPQVVVDRTDVYADESGHFSVVVPYAAAFEHNAVLTVSATSVPGITPVSVCCLHVNGARSGLTSSH